MKRKSKKKEAVITPEKEEAEFESPESLKKDMVDGEQPRAKIGRPKKYQPKPL